MDAMNYQKSYNWLPTIGTMTAVVIVETEKISMASRNKISHNKNEKRDQAHQHSWSLASLFCVS